MKPNTNSKWIYAVAGLSALLLAPLGAALARPTQCITDETTCDYDKLCAFKVDLAEKILIYKTFVRNSPKTQAGARHGIKYDGALYEAAMKEAKAEDPTAKGEDLASLAYDTFVNKVRLTLKLQAREYANCKSLETTAKPSLIGDWDGMLTDKVDCNVYGTKLVNGKAERVTMDELKDSSQGCLEMWNNDRGHEAVHQAACRERLAQRGSAPPQTARSYIEEDIQAYRYSIEHSSNELKRLQLLCTADPKTDAFRERADRLLRQAASYQRSEASK